jgi:hypothetical protein
MAQAAFSVPSVSSVVSPLQDACMDFWQWLNRPAAAEARALPSQAAPEQRLGRTVRSTVAPRPQHGAVAKRWSGPQVARPLRVVKVVEDGAVRTQGRLVISGRLADVCAELDRLVAQEALGR